MTAAQQAIYDRLTCERPSSRDRTLGHDRDAHVPARCWTWPQGTRTPCSSRAAH